MEYLKNKYLAALYVILGIAVYIFAVVLSGSSIGIREILVGVAVFVLYYIADIFDLDDNRYKLKIFLVSIGVNAVLAVFSLLFMTINEAVLIFGFQFAYQNIAKIIIFDLFLKEKGILIAGLNYKTEMLKKIIATKGMYHVVGIVTADGIVKDGNNILGKYSDMVEISKKYSVDKVIVVEEGIFEQELLSKLLNVKLEGIRVYNFLDFYEKIEEKIPVKTINENWFLFGNGFELIHNNLYIRIKRIADLLFAVIISIPAIPIMAFSALIIKIESKGPIFFIQERIGKGNKRFKIVKFRSMVVHDKEKHSKYAGEQDSRITRFGKFMRKTRIDELPQLYNVFKGEMSFVGPRPEWDELCLNYMEKIPFYSLRHSVQPGLTGWAQVNYSYGASIEDAVEKLQYDLYYIKNYSLMLDIIIFFKTIKTVIFGRGR